MTDTGLSQAESRDLRRVAGLMVPASEAYKVPGADDPKIVADIDTDRDAFLQGHLPGESQLDFLRR